MAIRQRNGKWQADTKSPVGTRIRRSFETRQEAERFLAAHRPIKETPTKEANNAGDTLRRMALSHRQERQQSAKLLMVQLAGRNPARTRSYHVAAVCAQWDTLKPGTRMTYHTGLRRVLEAVGAPLEAYRAIPHVKAPGPRLITVPDDEFERVFAVASLPLRFCMLAARECAIRSGTIYKLSPANIRDGHIVAVTKNSQPIIVPVSPRLRAIIRVAQENAETPETPILQTLGLRASNFWKSVISRHLARAQSLANAGNWYMHDLRRTAAQRLYAATGDLRAAQSLLGHSNLTATLHYLAREREPITPAQLASLLPQASPPAIAPTVADLQPITERPQ